MAGWSDGCSAAASQSQAGRHDRPAAHEHVEYRGAAQEQPRPVPAAGSTSASRREEHQREGEPLGLGPADDPFARHVEVLQQEQEERGRQDREPPAGTTAALSRCHDQANSAQVTRRIVHARAAGGEPQRGPAAREVEHLVRVGRLQENIAGRPAGVPEVDGLAQVIRLVDLRRRPRPLEAENGEDQQRFERGLATGHQTTGSLASGSSGR